MDEAIEGFLKIQKGEALPRYVRASKTSADSGDISWESHDQLLEQMKNSERMRNAKELPAPDFSLLDLKIELAKREMGSCKLCPRECGVDRLAGPGGFCGSSADLYVHWEGILYGEEKELIPSHEAFVSGCSMRCAFCYSHERIIRPQTGTRLSPEEFGELANRRKREGALNLNIAGGDPMIHIYSILRALKTASSVPVVWNTNMYASQTAMKLLDGIADLYLGDIHFGCDECARNLASTPRYMESITRTFLAAKESGAAVIARHLVLPGHIDCCLKPALEWAKKYLPDAPFHLMPQYSPEWRARKMPGLEHPLSEDEKRAALSLARKSGLRVYERKPDIAERNMAFYKYAQQSGASEAPVDILIRSNGEIVISRLTGELTEVARALSDANARSLGAGKEAALHVPEIHRRN